MPPQSNQSARVLSSVGSEHLVYTQRVGGSTPSGPTKEASKEPLFYFTPITLRFPGHTRGAPTPINSPSGKTIGMLFRYNLKKDIMEKRKNNIWVTIGVILICVLLLYWLIARTLIVEDEALETTAVPAFIQSSPGE